MQITPGFVLLACLASLKSVAALPLEDRRTFNEEFNAREIEELVARRLVLGNFGKKIGAELGNTAATIGLNAAANSVMGGNQQQQRRGLDEELIAPALELDARDFAELAERAIRLGALGKNIAGSLGSTAAGIGLTMAADKLMGGGQQTQPQARELDELDARAIRWANIGKSVAGTVGSAAAGVGLTMAADKLMGRGQQQPQPHARELDELDARAIRWGNLGKSIAGTVGSAAASVGLTMAADKLMGGSQQPQARDFDELDARAVSWGHLGKSVAGTLGSTAAGIGLTMAADKLMGGSQQQPQARELDELDARAFRWGNLGKSVAGTVGSAAASVGLTAAADSLMGSNQQQAREIIGLDTLD